MPLLPDNATSFAFRQAQYERVSGRRYAQNPFALSLSKDEWVEMQDPSPRMTEGILGMMDDGSLEDNG